ncbi:DUF5325 family protein [Alteribacter populi]|uniref:DUF5325 family protein n=1 Tax=Alteribacter populi TaxID=2011011 RepID=UPI0012FD48F7|nr:DUF5325 family protein [Alteribacter populi]
MKPFHWPLFIMAALSAFGIAGIGIGLAEGSLWIILGAILVTGICVRGGFSIRNKMYGN